MRFVRDPEKAARLRAEMHRKLVEHAGTVDFPVYAGEGTAVLSGVSGPEGAAQSVQTTVGELLAEGPDGLLVMVWTDREPGRDVPAELRTGRRASVLDAEQETETGTPQTWTATVRVDGTAHETVVHQHNGWLAFQTTVHDLVVTAVSNHPEPPALQTVPDLTACAERRPAWNQRLAERYRTLRPPQPEPEMDPAPGSAAHNALITFVLANRPRDPRWKPMWDRAAAHQRELRGQDEETAVDEVIAMVNQCTALAEELPKRWPEVADRVIDQCVRHTTGEQVETEALQRLWRSAFDQGEPGRARHAARQRWLAGWTDWLAG